MAHKLQASVLVMVLPHFDVICDLLLKRRTVTWNLAQPDINNRVVRSRNVCESSVHNSLEFSQHRLVFISGYADKKRFLLLYSSPGTCKAQHHYRSLIVLTGNANIFETISCDHGLCYANRGIFVYTLCPLTYAYHYVMTLIK